MCQDETTCPTRHCESMRGCNSVRIVASEKDISDAHVVANACFQINLNTARDVFCGAVILLDFGEVDVQLHAKLCIGRCASRCFTNSFDLLGIVALVKLCETGRQTIRCLTRSPNSHRSRPDHAQPATSSKSSLRLGFPPMTQCDATNAINTDHRSRMHSIAPTCPTYGFEVSKQYEKRVQLTCKLMISRPMARVCRARVTRELDEAEKDGDGGGWVQTKNLNF